MAIQQMFLGVGAALQKPYFGDTAIWAGGLDVTNQANDSPDQFLEVTQWASIPTTGTVSTGGDLIGDRHAGGGCSNGSRALYSAGFHCGGVWANRYTKVKSIDYQTISTKNACSDFGDMTTETANLTACSNGTRAVLAAGETSLGRSDSIEYVVIDTTSGASNFGNLDLAREGPAGLSNGTRGVIVAGAYFGVSGTENYKNIEYITIDTNGNGTDLCDLNVGGTQTTGCCNGVRAIVTGFNGSSGPQNHISYFDPTSTTDAQDFGNLTTSRAQIGTVCNETRAVFAGGGDSNGEVIDYVTIASTGDASDFGDLNPDSRAMQTASGD